MTHKNESTEDFKERLAQTIPKPAQSPQDRPCVRQPGDHGYNPPDLDAARAQLKAVGGSEA